MFAAGALALLGLLGSASGASGIELCSPEAKGLMRKAEIGAEKIERLCRMAARTRSLLSLSMKRGEDELGYCLVTLALHNNSTDYLNQMALASSDRRFENFRFHNIMPGTTGYASARSRILLACDELPRLGISLRWPASLRIGDRSPQGKRLARYKPALLDKVMRWAR